MSVNGTLVEDKRCVDSMVNVDILASSVPFTLTKVQVPNLALTNTKWITLQIEVSDPYIYAHCSGYASVTDAYAQQSHVLKGLRSLKLD